MRVISYLKSEIPGTNLYDLNLEEFSSEPRENPQHWLLYGYRILEKGVFKSSPRPGVYKYLNVTMPTEYCQQDFVYDNNKYFDEIYGICKYSCYWLNYLEQSTRHKYIYYPVSVPETLHPFSSKSYDIIYHGGIHSDKYDKMLQAISKYNYRYATMSRGINARTQYSAQLYATNLDLNPFEKYHLLSQCKISIAFNNFPLSDLDISHIKAKPHWQHNHAFSHLESKLAPQFKSRVNEAAALGVINLVERDQWNVIEDFYSAEDEFIYFDSVEELPRLITYILDNYNQYYTMRKRAFQRALRYKRENAYYDIAASKQWPN
jgi:hypothetical protein